MGLSTSNLLKVSEHHLKLEADPMKLITKEAISFIALIAVAVITLILITL